MAILKRDLDQLIARMGRENVLTSEADLLVYSTDAGAPPALVDVLVKRRADAVVRCKTLAEVETAVRFCKKRRIPMTPRAAATSALGGAVPKRAGVVLDLTGMKKDVAIDEANLRVTVDAGVVIADLREKLQAVGLDLPCYPTSGLAATIGGFVCMDGHGIGSTRHGNIGRHVVELVGVGADGERFRARDAEQLGFYLGMGGSTGVVTQVTMKVVEASPDKPVLATFTRLRELQAFTEEARGRFDVKHIMFHNDDFYALRAEAKKARKNPLAGKLGVTLCFAEKDADKHAEAVERMVARHNGQLADQKVADEEWAERFYPIRAKRLGPSLVAGEVFVPVAKVASYLRKLRAKVHAYELAVEGHVTDDGRVYFFIYTLDDERRPTYPLGWGTSAWILRLAKQMGGNAYHPGVWLQWEATSVFGATRYKKLKVLKKQADPRLLMNPGMVFPLPAPIPEFVYKMPINGPTPAPSLGFQLAAGNPMLRHPEISAMGMVRPYRRRKTVGVAAADAAGDMARGDGLGMHSDLIWGCDIPSLQAIPNPGDLPMTQTPRGKMVLAKAFVQGKINDPWTLKPALDVAEEPADDVTVAPEYADVLEVLDAFRRTVQAEGVELDVQAVEIEEEEEVVEVGAEKKGGGLDIEAIKKQAAETPEAEKAWVLAADCIVCNGCESACPTAAAIVTDIARVDRDLCIADGGCFDACPTDAIRPGEEDKEASAGWPEGSRLAGKFGV